MKNIIIIFTMLTLLNQSFYAMGQQNASNTMQYHMAQQHYIVHIIPSNDGTQQSIIVTPTPVNNVNHHVNIIPYEEDDHTPMVTAQNPQDGVHVIPDEGQNLLHEWENNVNVNDFSDALSELFDLISSPEFQNQAVLALANHEAN